MDAFYLHVAINDAMLGNGELFITMLFIRVVFCGVVGYIGDKQQLGYSFYENSNGNFNVGQFVMRDVEKDMIYQVDNKILKHKKSVLSINEDTMVYSYDYANYFDLQGNLKSMDPQDFCETIDLMEGLAAAKLEIHENGFASPSDPFRLHGAVQEFIKAEFGLKDIICSKGRFRDRYYTYYDYQLHNDAASYERLIRISQGVSGFYSSADVAKIREIDTEKLRALNFWAVLNSAADPVEKNALGFQLSNQEAAYMSQGSVGTFHIFDPIKVKHGNIYMDDDFVFENVDKEYASFDKADKAIREEIRRDTSESEYFKKFDRESVEFRCFFSE